MRDCLIFLYYDGQIVESEGGVSFQSRNSLSFYVDQNINFENFRNEIDSRLRTETGRSISTVITYRFPISLIQQRAEYRTYMIRNDEELQLLFDCYRRYYPNICVAELIVDLEEIHEEGAAFGDVVWKETT